MICSKCGTPAEDPTQRFCEKCGSPLGGTRNEWAAGNPGAQTGPASGPAPVSVAPAQFDTLPGTKIRMGAGERLWRVYQAVQLRSRAAGEGTLFVTDARIVFFARARGRGTQRPSMLIQQTKLDNVTGLAAYVSRRMSLTLLLLVLFGAFLTLISLVTFNILFLFIFGALTFAGILALAGGAAKRGSTGVIIHSGATDASPIGFGRFDEQRSGIGQLIHAIFGPLFALFGVHTAFDVLIGFPGQDSEEIIGELGALIFDLQSRGSLAEEHWRDQSATRRPGRAS